MIDWYRISPSSKGRSHHTYVDSGRGWVRKFGSRAANLCWLSEDILTNLNCTWFHRESWIISSGSLCPRFVTYELFLFINCNWYVLNKHTFSRVQYRCIVRFLQHRGNRGNCLGYNFKVSYYDLAKNISLRRYILKKTNLDFFFIFPGKGYLSGWGLGLCMVYGLSTVFIQL